MIVKYRLLVVVLGLTLALIGGLSYMGGTEAKPSEVKLNEKAADIIKPLTPEEQAINKPVITNTMNRIAVLETTEGTVEIELFEDTMPVTTGNFTELIGKGFYDGIKFHRVIPNFMVQGGDPLTKEADTSRWGTGGPGYSIKDEFVKGDLLTNTRGTISMANSGPNTGGSQFFINVADNTFLDGKHPVFGRVISGMDVVDQIVHADRNERDMPLKPITILKATLREPAAASSTEATTTAQ
jgi:peptidylprolyl isomerase